jgi:hypothetical protein
LIRLIDCLLNNNRSIFNYSNKSKMVSQSNQINQSIIQ